jgi:ribose transport system permease protein
MRVILRRLNNRENLLIVFLILFSLLIGALAPHFLSGRNWVFILDAAALVGIIALGESLVIIGGGIDISVGATAVASAMALGTLIVFFHVPPVVAIAACLLLGAGLGAINGLFIGYLRLPAIIVTLAALRIYRGGLEILTPGQAIPAITDVVPFLAFTKIGPFPLQVVVFFLMAIVVAVFLAHTRLGRSIYAVGGNPAAAAVAGVDVRRVQVATYALCGLLAAVASVLYYARASGLERYSFWGIEFLAIATIVMGGANIAGGAGKILGTFIGTVLLYAIYNAMMVVQIDAAWQSAVTGALILVAVSLQSVRGREDD